MRNFFEICCKNFQKRLLKISENVPYIIQ
jgi:hypothetical protein